MRDAVAWRGECVSTRRDKQSHSLHRFVSLLGFLFRLHGLVSCLCIISGNRLRFRFVSFGTLAFEWVGCLMDRNPPPAAYTISYAISEWVFSVIWSNNKSDKVPKVYGLHG